MNDNDDNFATAIAGAIIGYLVIQWIADYWKTTKDTSEAFKRRLEFYRREAPRLVAEENNDGS